MEELATLKIKRCLVEPCWWGTHNSPHFILIPFSGKFQACQEVFSCNIEKYWVSQFHCSCRIKHVESHRPMNEKWPWMFWPCIIPAKCVMAEAPSRIPILLNKRHFLCFQCTSLSLVGSFVFLCSCAHRLLACAFCQVKAPISHILEVTTCQMLLQYVP